MINKKLKYLILDRNSRTTSTVHGWDGENNVSINDTIHNSYNGYKTDMEINDILVLLIDVDQHLIRLTNERTHRTCELNINVTKSTLPWQFNLGLMCPGDRIHLLS